MVNCQLRTKFFEWHRARYPEMYYADGTYRYYTNNSIYNSSLVIEKQYEAFLEGVNLGRSTQC